MVAQYQKDHRGRHKQKRRGNIKRRSPAGTFNHRAERHAQRRAAQAAGGQHNAQHLAPVAVKPVANQLGDAGCVQKRLAHAKKHGANIKRQKRLRPRIAHVAQRGQYRYQRSRAPKAKALVKRRETGVAYHTYRAVDAAGH